MDIVTVIQAYLPKALQKALIAIDVNELSKAEEIRIRVNKRVYIKYGENKIYTEYKPDTNDIEIIMQKMSDYSPYAFSEEIRRGYITLKGGCRVGICGSTIINDKGVQAIKDISSLNIRISRQIIDCGTVALKYIFDGENFLNTLIVSPPGCGKTTLLRDIIRLISNKGLCVSVIDERSEIAGTYMGQAENDLGENTDVLDGCIKSYGMPMVLRSMCPKVIAVDELDPYTDLKYIKEIINCGVGIICTIHSEVVRDKWSNLIKEGYFKRCIMLNSVPKVGSISGVYNEELVNLCTSSY